MKSLFKKLAAALGLTWVWSLLLVLLLACVVWWIGPLLAVDDRRFWLGATSRLLTISGLFLAWGLTMVFVNRRDAVQPFADDAGPGQVNSKQRKGLVEHEHNNVRGRFTEALQALKMSRRYGKRGKRWRNELPWYLVMGCIASGKTRLLQAGGLQQPLDRVGSGAPHAEGAVRHCEWYFAEQGVLIETPARYLTHADADVDSGGWATLLNLLKARRRARPLSGVLLTLSVDSLLNGSEQELSVAARQFNSRLHDLQQTLHVELPVYLVLTQADHMPGFAEFFEHTQGHAHDDLWGEPILSGKTGTDIAEVRQAFETLLQRLSAELIQRLHLERNGERRGRMLDFPRQVAQIGERLCLFIELAFSAHRYQRVNALRGVYLTSSGNAAHSRPRFIQGLFKRVVFGDVDLAGLDQRERVHIRRRQRGLALAAFLVLGGMGSLWMYSYSQNHQRLEQLRELARPPVPGQAAEDPILAMVALLDSRLAATQVFAAPRGAGWWQFVGLFQGSMSRPVLDTAYQQALLQHLLARVSEMLEDQVRNSVHDRQQLLVSLRAYLMLNLPEHRDKPWLMDRVAGLWSGHYPADPGLQARLNAHFAQLLEQPFVRPLDETLVAHARQALKVQPLAGVVYRLLREQGAELEPYRFTQHLDPHEQVFAGIDQPIPGFFTQHGYRQFFAVQGSRMVDTILRDNWVLGEGTQLSATGLRQLMVELEQHYFSDYAQAWGAALAQVRLQQSDSTRQVAGQLASLTSARSPLVQLLQQVRENTRFASPVERLEALQPGSPVAQTVLDSVAQRAPDNAQRALQRRFEALHHLLDEQDNPGPALSQMLQTLNQLQLQLAALGRESQPERAAFEMVKRRMQGQQDALGNLRNATERLPAALHGWLAAMADDSWRLVLDDAYRHLNRRYQSEVYGFYSSAIKQRYPFSAHASSDVALNDFREFFKPQGLMARFLDEDLRPFVIGDGHRYRLRSLDGRSLPMSRALLEQLAKARTIRQAFFADDPSEPGVRFTLAPYSLDPTVSRATLRFGDQQMEYRHGPIVPMLFQWPTTVEDGRSSLVLEGMAQRPMGIEKNTGPWSLFRLFDVLQGEAANGRDARLLKADIGGLRANYLLTSQRTPNPFEMAAWRTFRIPEQL